MSPPSSLHPLPPLSDVLERLPAPDHENRLDRTIETIRQVALACRAEESRAFYSMREFERTMAVPLRTVAIAFERLEADGLLLRLRGSHTRLLGQTAKPTAPITSVIGWLENIFILRHYLWRRSFTRSIGDVLRKHHFTTDLILHWEYEDREYDLVDRVLLHLPDAAVWFHPFRPTRETIATLRDHGIRNLIVSDREVPGIEGDIVINWDPAYRRTLDYWQREHGITQIVMLEGNPHSAHRLRRFETLAHEYGMECVRFALERQIAGRLLASPVLRRKSGIVLLDEWAAVDFSMREPAAFLALTRRHRVLYGREFPSIPFLEPGQYRFEVLRYPTGPLQHAIRDRLLQWHAGDLQSAPMELDATLDVDWTHHMWM